MGKIPKQQKIKKGKNRTDEGFMKPTGMLTKQTSAEIAQTPSAIKLQRNGQYDPRSFEKAYANVYGDYADYVSSYSGFGDGASEKDKAVDIDRHVDKAGHTFWQKMLFVGAATGAFMFKDRHPIKAVKDMPGHVFDKCKQYVDTFMTESKQMRDQRKAAKRAEQVSDMRDKQQVPGEKGVPMTAEMAALMKLKFSERAYQDMQAAQKAGDMSKVAAIRQDVQMAHTIVDKKAAENGINPELVDELSGKMVQQMADRNPRIAHIYRGFDGLSRSQQFDILPRAPKAEVYNTPGLDGEVNMRKFFETRMALATSGMPIVMSTAAGERGKEHGSERSQAMITIGANDAANHMVDVVKGFGAAVDTLRSGKNHCADFEGNAYAKKEYLASMQFLQSEMLSDMTEGHGAFKLLFEPSEYSDSGKTPAEACMYHAFSSQCFAYPQIASQMGASNDTVTAAYKLLGDYTTDKSVSTFVKSLPEPSSLPNRQLAIAEVSGSQGFMPHIGDIVTDVNKYITAELAKSLNYGDEVKRDNSAIIDSVVADVSSRRTDARAADAKYEAHVIDIKQARVAEAQARYESARTEGYTSPIHAGDVYAARGPHLDLYSQGEHAVRDAFAGRAEQEQREDASRKDRALFERNSQMTDQLNKGNLGDLFASTTPVAPSPVAPVAPSPVAPIAPSPVAPIAPSPVAPVAPSSATPVAPSSATPVAPSSAAPVAPSPAAPVDGGYNGLDSSDTPADGTPDWLDEFAPPPGATIASIQHDERFWVGMDSPIHAPTEYSGKYGDRVEALQSDIGKIRTDGMDKSTSEAFAKLTAEISKVGPVAYIQSMSRNETTAEYEDLMTQSLALHENSMMAATPNGRDAEGAAILREMGREGGVKNISLMYRNPLFVAMSQASSASERDKVAQAISDRMDEKILDDTFLAKAADIERGNENEGLSDSVSFE